MTLPNKEYSFNDFIVVLVLYRTVLEECNSYVTLARALHEDKKIDLVVYDNSPVAKERSGVFESRGFNVRYISDTSNPGIGKAYNTAIKIGRENKKKWILFLDQDTQIAPNLLGVYLTSVNTERDMHIFSSTLFGGDGRLISPSKYRFKRGFRLKGVPEGRVLLEKIRPINSLLLLSMEVFQTVGVYNEKIKLDFSDHEFLGRVEKHYKEMFVVQADNRHSLSSSDDHNLESIKSRFVIFCQGAHVAGGSGVIDGMQYFIVCLLRSIRLGMRHRTLFFIKVLFKEWKG